MTNAVPERLPRLTADAMYFPAEHLNSAQQGLAEALLSDMEHQTTVRGRLEIAALDIAIQLACRVILLEEALAPFARLARFWERPPEAHPGSVPAPRPVDYERAAQLLESRPVPRFPPPSTDTEISDAALDLG